ncbi:hypothetical protein AGMMS49938_16720 [Fibrobacterales bacterium]|nr:hypothetical protein AGMMS49938_16720 [Fibrobacterales bacterium]
MKTVGEWVKDEFGTSEEEVNGIAIAVNEAVVPRSKWDTVILNENDKILAVQAAQGG